MSAPGGDQALDGPRLLQSLTWVALRIGGRQGLNTVAFLVLAATLTPAELGQGAVAVAAALIARIAVYRGLRDCVLRTNAPQRDWLGSAFTINAALGIVLALGLAVAGVLTGAPHGVGGLLLLAAAIPAVTGATAIAEASVERALHHRQLTIAQFVASLIASAAAIIAVASGAGAAAVVILTLVEVIVFGAACLWLGRAALGFCLKSAVAGSLIREASPIFVVAMLNGGWLRALHVIVSVLLGYAAAGQFRLASQVFQLLFQFVFTPVIHAAPPNLSRSQASDTAIYVRTLTIFTFVSAPCFFIAAVVIAPLLTVLVGDEWASAGIAAAILCIGLPAMIASDLTPVLLISRNQNRSAPPLALINAASALLFASLAALVFGTIEAAAAGLVARVVVTGPFALLVARAEMGASLLEQLHPLAVYLACAAVCAGSLAGIGMWLQLGPFALAAGAGLALLGYAVLFRWGVKRLHPRLYEETMHGLPDIVKRFG